MYLVQGIIIFTILGCIIFFIIKGIVKGTKSALIKVDSIQIDYAEWVSVPICNSYQIDIPKTLQSSVNFFYSKQKDFMIQAFQHDYKSSFQDEAIIQYLQMVFASEVEIVKKSEIKTFNVNDFTAKYCIIKCKKNKCILVVYDCVNVYISLCFSAYNSSFDSVIKKIMSSFNKRV